MCCFFFFFKQKTAYEISACLVGSEMCIRDRFALVDWSGQNRDHELRALVDWDFRNRLLAQPGVASLVTVGGGVKQYLSLIDPIRMRKLTVSLADIEREVRAA